MRSTPLIAVVNHAKTIGDAEVQNMIPALQHQITYDVRPRWDVMAHFQFYAAGTAIPNDAWQLGFFDNSDQAGALGYHALTPTGMPYGKVFAETCKADGVTPSACASHESVELLADPYCSLAFQTTDTRFLAQELCDAVEDDTLGYSHVGADGVTQILLSDFVLPAWFTGAAGPYDFRNHLTAAYQLAEGGYISIFVSGQGWSQSTMRNGELVAVDPDVNDPRFRHRG